MHVCMYVYKYIYNVSHVLGGEKYYYYFFCISDVKPGVTCLKELCCQKYRLQYQVGTEI